jgi:hypothetical protein
VLYFSAIREGLQPGGGAMALELVANVGRVLQALAVERRNIDR